MRQVALIAASLCMVGAAGSPLLGQTTDTLKKLNAILVSSCYNSPVLQLSADGTVVRKDAGGGTMTFKFVDIGSMTIDTDNQAHVLLKCKEGAACIVRVAAPGATQTSIKLLAFSFDSMEMGDSVLRLFQELQASVVKTGGWVLPAGSPERPLVNSGSATDLVSVHSIRFSGSGVRPS
jgi:hypothetical protein